MLLRFSTLRTPRRSVAFALAASLLLPPALLPAAALAQSASSGTAADLAAVRIPVVPAADGPIRTILMFPFVSKSADAASGGFDGAVVGAQVQNAVKIRLNTIGRYKANSFAPNLPQIQRAVQDSRVAGLTEADVVPPYDTSLKGRKLAQQLATDGYLLGEVDSVSVNPQTRTVSVVIDATLYSTLTGRVVKTFAATGRGISFNAADDPAALLQSAVNDAAGHVVAALNADLTQGQPVIARDLPAKRRHNKAGEIALGLLVAAAVAIGLTTTHHHHSSSGSSSTATGTTTTTTVTTSTPPAPPITGF